MNAAPLEVFVAPSFMRDYRKAGVALQGLAEGAVKDLIRLAEADPKGWRRRYDRVAGLAANEPVLEVDLAGGPRLLAVDEDALILWRMGDHGLVDLVVRTKPPLPRERQQLPSHFKPGSLIRLFPPDADEGFVDYANERTGDWAYWLDEQQYTAGTRITNAVEEAFLTGGRVVHGVMGGPGTGKTTIMVWLLKALATNEPGGAMLDVRLSAPASVVNQIENSTGWDLVGISLDTSAAPLLLDEVETNDTPDVILMDDPSSLQEVSQVVGRYPRASVIFGFDPLQMSMSITDAALESWLADLHAGADWFTACYRQKEVVGRAAKHVADTVASSSPFLRADKKDQHHRERAELTRRANETLFVNPSGMVQTVRDPAHEDWGRYWKYLYRLRREGRLWNHWAPLLVITDPEAAIPPNWLARIDAVSSHRKLTTELPAIKGLEYQHLLMLLSERLYQELENGFEGKGQNEYNRYRLFRIPFSRAKDSIVSFIFPTISD